MDKNTKNIKIQIFNHTNVQLHMFAPAGWDTSRGSASSTSCWQNWGDSDTKQPPEIKLKFKQVREKGGRKNIDIHIFMPIGRKTFVLMLRHKIFCI